MNYNKTLQGENRSLRDQLQPAKNALQGLADYANSPKYWAVGSAMNPADVVLRVREGLDGITDVEFYGKPN